MINLLRRQRNTIPLLLLLSFLGASRLMAAEQAAPAPAVREYTFGSLPFLAQPTLEGIFAPLAAELGDALHRQIRYQSTANFGKFQTLQYFDTHQACLQALLIGDIDTCAAGIAVARVFEAQTQRPLRVILTSPEIPQALFVFHPRVPIADREIIKKTLLATRLSGVEQTLRKLFLPSADDNKGGYFLPVTDKDYDIVRHYLEMVGHK